MGQNLKNKNFPSSDFAEENEATTHRCLSYGEATSANPGLQLSGANTAQIFKSLYHRFTKETTIWFAYNDANDYELPSNFRFLEVYDDGPPIFEAIISPGVLPVGFHQGRNRHYIYDFYCPSIVARQLGFGQLPIGLYFADKLRAREFVNNALEFNRMHILAWDFPPIKLS